MSEMNAEGNEYPEAEKFAKMLPEYQVQEAFVLWLNEHGYWLGQYRCPHGRLQDDMVNCTESESCRNGEQPTRLYGAAKALSDLLYEYHDIDAKKLDDERRAMLDAYSNKESI